MWPSVLLSNWLRNQTTILKIRTFCWYFDLDFISCLIPYWQGSEVKPEQIVLILVPQSNITDHILLTQSLVSKFHCKTKSGAWSPDPVIACQTYLMSFILETINDIIDLFLILGMWAHTMTVQDYQDLIDRGWRR